MNFKNFRNFKNSNAFTLMELLIVIALIALIAAGLLVLINPMQQFAKAHDTKRKFELDALRRAFEDYYNDKGCYPLPKEVCYEDEPINVCEISKTTTSQICHICGREPTPPQFAKFAPYLSQLPCDPEHPKKDYLYEVDVSCSRATGPDGSCITSRSGCTTCPKWYRIYSDLSINNDSDSINIGCYSGGCGLNNPPLSIPQYGYDYGVSSPNTGLNYSNDMTCVHKYDIDCHGCGDQNNDGQYNTYADCLLNAACNQDKIYATYNGCCCANSGVCKCK